MLPPNSHNFSACFRTRAEKIARSILKTANFRELQSCKSKPKWFWFFSNCKVFSAGFAGLLTIEVSVEDGDRSGTHYGSSGTLIIPSLISKINAIRTRLESLNVIA